MASDVVKGGWAPDEDEKLVKGIERYGTRSDLNETCSGSGCWLVASYQMVIGRFNGTDKEQWP